ncbi:FtsQ-type POTRA domain-containing protein [Patescibacteria group bacterium]|nr:FtsQ-type POTRA domain-containing protein [Patescibacteria group bacterium]
MKYKSNIKLILILIFFSLAFILIEFRIKSVYLYNVNTKYESKVYNLIQKQYINSNIFFVGSSNILQSIKEFYPLAKSVKIDRIYPNRINIYIKSENIAFVYKQKTKYFFVTQNGSILNGFYTQKYPVVKSNSKLSSFYKNKLITLINDVGKQTSFKVSYYELSNDTVSLYLSTDQIAIMTFNRSLTSQIGNIIYIINNLSVSRCKTMNVEFNKVYCSI